MDVMGRVCVWKMTPLRDFQRHYLKEYMEKEHKEWALLELESDNNQESCSNGRQKTLRLMVPNVNDKMAASAVARIAAHLKAEQTAKEHHKKIGFTAFIDVMRKSGKPIVGHHCMLDLLYTYQTFHGPLPDSLPEFRKEMHEYMPIIFDTKHLMHALMEKDSRFKEHVTSQSLEALYELFHTSMAQGPAVVRLEEEEDGALACHTAAYDAFMTGEVFLRLICALGFQLADLVALSGTNTGEIATTTATSSRTQELALMTLANQLSLDRFQPISSISLEEHNGVPDRSNFVRLSPVPITTSMSEIKRIVSNAINVQILKLHVYRENATMVSIKLPCSQDATLLLTHTHRNNKEDLRIQLNDLTLSSFATPDGPVHKKPKVSF